MDLEECRRKGFIRKTKINRELICSLIEMAKIKEITVTSAEINGINVSAYVSLAYDSLREILEALCVSRGYKVTSHFCTGELLRTLLENFEYSDFDRYRYIRNGINYYGTKIEFEQGKAIINKIFSLKNKLIKDYLKEFIP